MKTLIIFPLIIALVVIEGCPIYGAQQNDEITEVTFERKGCEGPCPIDKVTFRRDRAHSYIGIRNVVRVGNYKAEGNEYRFDELVKVLERVNYADLKEAYAPNTEDAPTITLSVTRAGKIKTVTSYDPERSPIELVIIQAFIENVIPKIAWKKVE